MERSTGAAGKMKPVSFRRFGAKSKKKSLD